MNGFHAKEKLPPGYRLAERIDLVKNRRQMLLVNGLAILLAVLMVLLGILIQPQGAAAIFDEEALHFALKCGVAAAASLVYIVGHEAVHGVFMWRISRKKPRFGFSFTYAYAGSDAFFAKSAYLVIALAPVVVWSVLLCLLCALLPAEWFWVVWLIQISNISGAAGDFYVFCRILKKPDAVLVQDTGTAMTVYLPQ